MGRRDHTPRSNRECVLSRSCFVSNWRKAFESGLRPRHGRRASTGGILDEGDRRGRRRYLCATQMAAAGTSESPSDGIDGNIGPGRQGR